jgi:hypothetical protein
MSDNEMPQEIEPKAAATFALTLLTHMLAFLVRSKRITPTELDEIFGTVVKAYSSLVVPQPMESWQKQIEPLLTLTRSDVQRWAQAD